MKTVCCAWCVESIGPDDFWVEGGADQRFHAECIVRATQGSAGHQLHTCPCYGGTRTDEPGLTMRQNAILAYEVFHYLQGRELQREATMEFMKDTARRGD